ncbi:YbfB/YjiJ family MFS transporter [Corynebacterium macginleyi]|nr:YbfB/YjiJ family MFS transporter [Corynebacterium macginleyi]
MGKPEGDAHSSTTETTHLDALSVKVTSSLARGTADPAVAIGLGRFFCTPPSLAVGCLGWLGQSRAWIATFNYAGYFAGSLAASRG